MTAAEIRLARLTQRINRLENALEAVIYAMQSHMDSLVPAPQVTDTLQHATDILEAPDPLAGMRPDKENQDHDRP